MLHKTSRNKAIAHIQTHKNVIPTNLVKKCLEMFAEMVEQKDDDENVCEQCGRCLKIVMREDSTNRAMIAELFRFNTSKSGGLHRPREGRPDRRLLHHK